MAMQTLHFSIFINAPVEKVWDTMLNRDTYREWTKAFNGESDYEGSWEEGENIRFVDSKGNGMLARIKENRSHEFISIEHYGMINDGIEDTSSEEVKAWTPAYENYTFEEKDGGTEVIVDMDTNDEYAEMFKEMWPKGLEKLKELCEK